MTVVWLSLSPARLATAADKITKSISAYTAKLSVSPEKAYELYKTHGTCLKGMLAEGLIDKDSGVEEFLHEVHLIDYSDIASDPELAAVLGRITKPAMWVFTASTVEHATRCIEAVGLTQLPIKGRLRPAMAPFRIRHTMRRQLLPPRAYITTHECHARLEESSQNSSARRHRRHADVRARDEAFAQQLRGGDEGCGSERCGRLSAMRRLVSARLDEARLNQIDLRSS